MLTFTMAFRNIFRQKRRTLLTVLMMLGGFALSSISIAWSDGTCSQSSTCSHETAWDTSRFTAGAIWRKLRSGHNSQQGTEKEREGRAPLHWRRNWAELLRLVFEVKLTCPRCQAEMKIISFITETEPIRKILAHLKEKGIDACAGPFEECAA